MHVVQVSARARWPCRSAGLPAVLSFYLAWVPAGMGHIGPGSPELPCSAWLLWLRQQSCPPWRCDAERPPAICPSCEVAHGTVRPLSGLRAPRGIHPGPSNPFYPLLESGERGPRSLVSSSYTGESISGPMGPIEPMVRAHVATVGNL
jgi:hypothetical protein